MKIKDILLPNPIDSKNFPDCDNKEVYFIEDDKLLMFLLKNQENNVITAFIVNDTQEIIKEIIDSSIRKEIKLVNKDSYQIDSENGKLLLKTDFTDKTSKISKIDIIDCFKPSKRLSLRVDVERQLSYLCHGRCMFEGCGERLNIDFITGKKGNFKNFAHIIAASENGPRGSKEESKKYENDPENFLVLCDKHHRLIDRIAPGLYTANRLRSMRYNFIIKSEDCLDSLAYPHSNVCVVVWPISSNSVAIPTEQEVIEAANILHLQTNRKSYYIENSNSYSITKEIWWSNLSNNLTQVESSIKSFYNDDKSILLFALGPTAAMIGLGAKLGNKNHIIPVPRLRKNGWGWLSQIEPAVFQIEECDKKKTNEVVLEVFLTDKPQCSEPSNLHNIHHVRISLANLDNSCISTNEISNSFLIFMINLFTQKLRSYKRIHILACASNVACIQLGRAIEHIHSDIILYDFNSEGNHTYWIPRLSINTNDKQIIIKGINDTQEK